MINRDKTKLKYGHTADNLPPTSKEKVVWQCDNNGCSHERTFTYSYYLKKRDKAFQEHEGNELCQKCSHAHRIGKVEKTETVKYPALAQLPPEVNIQQTIEVFGHDPQVTSSWSRKYVILNCSCCGKETETRRCNLNTYKSILETGHFKCTGCWTKERRTGQKASSETKFKQKISQQKRRMKEHGEDPNQMPYVAAVANGDFNNNSTSQQNKVTAQVIPFPNKKKD